MMNIPLNLHMIFRRNELWARREVISCMDDNTVHKYTYAGAVSYPSHNLADSCADFQKRVRRLCNVLTSLGVKPGDRVATLGYNHYQHLELYFAIRTCFLDHLDADPVQRSSEPSFIRSTSGYSPSKSPTS